MPIINYTYSPGTSIWYITDCGIKSGTIKSVSISVLESPPATGTLVTTLLYNIAEVGQIQTSKYPEVDVFATLAEAITEYEIRLGA